MYGADVNRPGDMDITLAPYYENLCHLSAALLEMEAGMDGSLGQWETNSDGESKMRRAIRLDVCGYLC